DVSHRSREADGETNVSVQRLPWLNPNPVHTTVSSSMRGARYVLTPPPLNPQYTSFERDAAFGGEVDVRRQPHASRRSMLTLGLISRCCAESCRPWARDRDLRTARAHR